LNFWVEQLLPVEAYQAWLQSAGAGVELGGIRLPDGSVWIKSRFEGVSVEADWQTWEKLESRLRSILAAEVLDHGPLTMAWTVFHALPVRGGSRVEAWRQALADYPEALQWQLIEETLTLWATPGWWPLSLISLWPLAHRAAYLELSGRINRELENTLRLLFAYNRQWEPEWEWVAPESKRLQHKPAHLVERINSIAVMEDGLQSLQDCFQLIQDVLNLISDSYDVSVQLQRVEEAIAFGTGS
jgi:hypothetical protein